jgi:hypothetical protein
MRFCVIKLAVAAQIKVEQRVMQQNQRDGTQPELVKPFRADLFPKF